MHEIIYNLHAMGCGTMGVWLVNYSNFLKTYYYSEMLLFLRFVCVNVSRWEAARVSPQGRRVKQTCPVA